MRLASKRILVATKNKGKVQEFAHAFAALGIETASLLDYPGIPDIVEDGDTFAANAEIKARAIANTFSLPVLADDSGLCVDALEGAPGVYSARYAGEGASDADNNAKLQRELALRLGDGAGEALSRARFVSALVLYDPATGLRVQAEGEVGGVIVAEPRGSGGFGYDPYFLVPEFAKTMAELTLEEKNAVSHRGKALRALLAQLV
ncbi:purine NTP phosphatase [Paenibacillus swuensis]|uniref:dITP/XTP pyrophosphatase n=1 Tax=Paenibacillus swuensis TaxID=1178515 RepID=A0A172TJA4_9BACL|nr:RdgB/HAM1 family non-canonical purine NTP pyrophosphatase [Paenibacillus swuensis]ANE47131.1 purine NTP phosphatase [Paenibacillus swuensis]